MSLKKTKEALALLAKFIEDCGPCEHAVNICVCGEKQSHTDALAEVEDVERAAKTLTAEDVAGMVYEVRDRAAADTSFTSNTWEHPRVVAYGAAAQVIDNIAKESK